MHKVSLLRFHRRSTRVRRERRARRKCIYIIFARADGTRNAARRALERRGAIPQAAGNQHVRNARIVSATRTYRVSRNSHVRALTLPRYPEASGNFFRWTADSCARSRVRSRACETSEMAAWGFHGLRIMEIPCSDHLGILLRTI